MAHRHIGEGRPTKDDQRRKRRSSRLGASAWTICPGLFPQPRPGLKGRGPRRQALGPRRGKVRRSTHVAKLQHDFETFERNSAQILNCFHIHFNTSQFMILRAFSSYPHDLPRPDAPPPDAPKAPDRANKRRNRSPPCGKRRLIRGCRHAHRRSTRVRSGRVLRPRSQPISSNSPTPSTSRVWNGSSGKTPCWT